MPDIRPYEKQPTGQVHMDRGPHAGAQVGRARVDVAVLGVQHKVFARLLLDGVADGLDATGQPVEDALDVAATLHGDDAQLVLFVDPGEEGLVLVVEDAAALRPVPLHASHLQNTKKRIIIKRK